MFDRQMRQYLELVRPWCSTEWTREIMESDQFVADFTNPSKVVFEIPERPLPGFWESLFLGPRKSQALSLLIAWVIRFNSTAACYAGAAPENRCALARTLHGVIGTDGAGTLRDVFRDAEASLKC